MKNKRWFHQEYIFKDYESPERYLIIIEVEDDTPITSFIVKLPRFYPEFSITPYLVN
jgi:hypothetical protein